MTERFTIEAAERRAIDEELAGAPSRNGTGQYIEDIMRERMKRRDFLKASGAVGVAGMVASVAPPLLAGEAHAASAPAHGARLQFSPITAGTEDALRVPEGYDYDIVLRWGDPLTPGAPPFDLYNQTRNSQAQQFGFNCDFIGYYPLPPYVRNSVEKTGALEADIGEKLQRHYAHMSQKSFGRSLLVVNHEYTSGGEMFPGYNADAPSEREVRVEIEAHGCSIVELARTAKGGQRFVQSSPFNRRVTGSTPMQIGGPLRDDPRMQTSYAPGGNLVRGMLNNCAGGKTPWGTVLTCEENFDQYFANFAALPPDSEAYLISARIPAPDGASGRKWENYVDRFDLAKEPNEYARFGYVVEIDPYDPTFKPVKQTALGRFKHEGAVPAISKDGRVAVYSGDDARFEYVYKFITAQQFQPHDRAHNLRLLSEGTLYVAKYKPDGTGEWLPLVPENPALVGWSLNDILLNTRGAADLLGATKMDRPEDIDVSPVTGKVYVTLTNNTRRTEVAADAGEVAANPRLNNAWGHIIEKREANDDPAALTFTWEIFILCGDPGNPAHGTFFAGFDQSQVSPLSSPDNLVFDNDGNLWIATDGMINSPDFEDTALGVGNTGNRVNDGVFAVPTEGADRGWLRQFLSGIPGGEICGPEFSADNRSFFCGIQHPGEDGGLPNEISAWPDGNLPPKPSVVVVYSKNGKKIGA